MLCLLPWRQERQHTQTLVPSQSSRLPRLHTRCRDQEGPVLREDTLHPATERRKVPPPVHVNLMPHSSPQGHFQPQFRLLQCQLPARTRLQGGPGLSHRAGGTEPPLPTPPAPPARAGAPGWKKRHFCTLGLAYLAPDQGFVEITCFLEEHWPWHHPPHACTRCSPHHRAFDILRGHVPISLSRVRVPPH